MSCQQGSPLSLRLTITRLALPLLVAAALGHSPSLHAEVTFQAGSVNPPVTVDTDGYVYVPVTTANFSPVAGVQFSLHWDPGVLTYNSVDQFASGLNLISGNFGPASPTETLTFQWNGDAGALSDATTTMFRIKFAPATANGNTDITFVDSPLERSVFDATANSLSASWDYGSVVVPEPINVAFGFFACAFAGWKGLRWWSANRKVRQPSICN